LVSGTTIISDIRGTFDDILTGGLNVTGESFMGDIITTGIEKGLRLETNGTPFSLHTASADFNGVRDDLLFLGYNILPGMTNTKINSSEPYFVHTIEANYFNGVKNYMEYNLNYQSADDSTFVRPMAFNIERASHETAWKFVAKGGLTGNGYFSIAGDRTSEQFVFRPNNSTRRMAFRYAGGSKEFLQIGYDGGANSPTAIMIGPSALASPELNIYNNKITTSSSVDIGIGITVPTQKLDVIGNIRINSTSIPTCDSTTEAVIVYNFTNHKHMGCNSTDWNALY